MIIFLNPFLRKIDAVSGPSYDKIIVMIIIS